MSTPEQDEVSTVPLTREQWETPVVVSCALRDTNKIKSNFFEDPNQGKAGS